MVPTRPGMRWLGCVLACLVWQSCKSASGEPNQSGSVRTSEASQPAARFYPGFGGYGRKITTSNADAQRWFDQGLQLLYGFNHDEAVRSFQRASILDPGCAMAHWGESYALGLHINNAQMGEAQSVAAFRAATLARNALDDETRVEHALVEAIAARYAMPVPEDRQSLDAAFAGAMGDAYRAHPEDGDVGALFAESLMNLQPWDLWTADGNPKGRTPEILDVLESTLLAHPNHPGANHFYIHAIEASPWPERGLPAAERLRNLVPGAGHLVHMPSHIFVRTGRYADAVASNEAAIAADEAYFAMAPKPDFYSLYFLHNVHFLSYSAMMEGRKELAMEAARKIETQVPAAFLRDFVTMADGLMPTALHVMIRFGDWEGILAEPEPPEFRLCSRAQRHYARSVALSSLDRTQAAAVELRLLDRVAGELTDEWYQGVNPASQVIAIARTMAEGELMFRTGDRPAAFALLRKAVEMEEALVYDEPPGWMQPVRHALGALLLVDGQGAAAEVVYRADLQRHPINAWSLLGLQQALASQGKADEAQEMETQVEAAWSRADVRPESSCYCSVTADGK